ncbi:MAG: methyltransferase, TIGR04325 family [Veillonellaceae bacterium]|nr:methyltransferase, TIGR04325 family [Veillonellaceae bacterium]
MKLVYLTTCYPIYINKFYEKNPELLRMSYSEQEKSLDYDAFAWADYWTHALQPLGYEVMGIRANVQPLQYAWTQEYGTQSPITNWVLDVPVEQIRRFKPDVLFMDEYSAFSRQWLENIRQVCPSIRLVLGWCGAPYQDASVFKGYDVVLSCVPELVEEFRAMGHQSVHLNHAFDPRILDRVDVSKKPSIDFSFIGQIMVAKQYHLQRAVLLREIVKHIDIQIFSPMTESSQQIPELRPFLKPSVFGLEMFQKLWDSRMTFNSHIGVSVNHASNMRMFEATGMGTCLVTDWKDHISNIFEPDREVVVYKNVEECISKVRWLLTHEKERNDIAEAGKKRVLREHTFSHRALSLDRLIREKLGKIHNSPITASNVASKQFGFWGDYHTWNDAVQNSSGYDSGIVFDKVKESLLKVKNGEAAYERDTVLFHKIQYSWPLLASLLWIASRNNSRLKILDFGGSLGSSYFQNKGWLMHLTELSWNIVEQSHFVEYGKQCFADQHLHFFYSMDECIETEKPRTLLLSNVLGYLEKPYGFLQKVMDMDFDYIIFDRTPFLLSDADRLTVQVVSPDIYEASYPCWLLSVNKVLRLLMGKYEMKVDFPVYSEPLEIPGVSGGRYLGFLLMKRGITLSGNGDN